MVTMRPESIDILAEVDAIVAKSATSEKNPTI